MTRRKKMSKALLHLMHKDEVYIRLRKEYMLLSHANKNPEVNKMLIRKLEGSISALEWILGFDYIDQMAYEQKEGEDNNDSNN
jgi:adenine C2-methylase RlmN of 23S rRNA A2503 and tRNA A37